MTHIASYTTFLVAKRIFCVSGRGSTMSIIVVSPPYFNAQVALVVVTEPFVWLLVCTRFAQGDATYLVVTEDKKVQDYGIVAVCTHLGCVVPWNKAENKFMCPCHGSQYDFTGKVRNRREREPVEHAVELKKDDCSDVFWCLFLATLKCATHGSEMFWAPTSKLGGLVVSVV